MVKALQAGVSPEGQKLFIAIAKTIQEITWSGPNIVVWDKITITPPYKIENVQGNSDDKAFNHIKKVVSQQFMLLCSFLTCAINFYLLVDISLGLEFFLSASKQNVLLVFLMSFVSTVILLQKIEKSSMQM